MTDKGRKYLSDILRAIELIEQFTASVDTFDFYDNDFKTQSAVERQIGIIGEALNKFEKIHPEISLQHSTKISGLRNRIIYAYDSIDNSIIWVILKKYIQPLNKEIKSIIIE
jgi:uncharacterized protein with HEPN domain